MAMMEDVGIQSFLRRQVKSAVLQLARGDQYRRSAGGSVAHHPGGDPIVDCFGALSGGIELIRRGFSSGGGVAEMALSTVFQEIVSSSGDRK